MAPESEGLFGYYKVTKFVKQGSIPTITTTPYENGIWQRFTGTSFIVSNLPDDNYIIIVAEDGPFIGTGTITLPADACRTAEIAIVTNCKKLDCDNYYIKSTIPNTNPAVESYKLNRKTTNNRLFDDLSLSLATFDGTSIPANLQYTWQVPAGQAPLLGAEGAS